ncbi:hypothetical protein CANMA_005423 [Candida margitis]|uniref:uncharacterized protein n=1 Tax=Candida margitis TaxID=1775924 RepID=UPI0022265A92|nr:uncharacterized protein CANMA_005423 [Candida margitis]KAI5949843.1 hypothetical protein CANMA_005423 [Candida margitis]
MSMSTSTNIADTSACLGILLKTVKELQSDDFHFMHIIDKSCKVQRGDSPTFNIDKLYEQYLSLIKSVTCIKLQIQQTNLVTYAAADAAADAAVDAAADAAVDAYAGITCATAAADSDVKTTPPLPGTSPTMMQLLVRKSMLQKHIDLLSGMILHGIPNTSSSSSSSFGSRGKRIKDISQVNVVEYESKYRELRKELVSLETKIQILNWK